MRKQLRLFLILLCTCLLCGCQTAVSQQLDTPNPYVCVKQTNADGSYLTYDYNATGDRTQETAYASDGAVQYHITYLYSDTTGWETEEICYTAEDSIDRRTVFEYDGGLCVKQTTYDADGAMTQIVESSYGENNWLVRESSYGADGEQTSRCDITYDADGNETKRVFQSSDGSPDLVTDSEYNSGCKIKTTSYTGSTCTGWHALTYDDDGRKITDTAYRADGTIEHTLQNIYDQESGMLSQVTQSGTDKPLYQYTYLQLSEYRKQ